MIKNYDYDVQKLYIELMLADAETFVRCQSIFDHTLFDRKLQGAGEFIMEYVKGYNVLPDFNMVNTSCKTNFTHPGEMKEGHTAWLLDEFEQFIRHKALERAIINSSDLLAQQDYGSVETLIKEAVQVGLARDMGIDYYADPRSRLMALKDRNGQMPSGWRDLDAMLFGGFNRGEIEVFCAVSGGGKSLFLANLAVNYSLAGQNAVYITLELSEALVGMRIDSMVTGIPSRDIFKQIDDLELKVKMTGKKAGSLQIKYLPSGKTTNDIRSYLKEYEVATGKKPDVILVDYLDLVHPISKKIPIDNLNIKDKHVSEELRNLAVEKNAILITASQLNRSGVEEIEYDHSHIAGGISKIQTADNVIGIFTSRQMRERGRYQIQLMKTRNSSGVGQKLDLEFNMDSLKISNVEDGDQEHGGQAVRGSESVLDAIKRRNSSSTETEEAVVTQPQPKQEPVDEPKIKVQTSSSRVRSLLTGFGTEDEDY